MSCFWEGLFKTKFSWPKNRLFLCRGCFWYSISEHAKALRIQKFMADASRNTVNCRNSHAPSWGGPRFNLPQFRFPCVIWDTIVCHGSFSEVFIFKWSINTKLSSFLLPCYSKSGFFKWCLNKGEPISNKNGFIYFFLRKANSCHMIFARAGLKVGYVERECQTLLVQRKCRHSKWEACEICSRARFLYIFVLMFPAPKVVDSTLFPSHWLFHHVLPWLHRFD